MFDILKSLTKAVVAVAVTPVTAVVDVLMIPADAIGGKDFATRTGALLSAAAENVADAVTPDKDK